ncbi:glycerophosphodiester phosphodiesterase [Turicibacter sanguinis]|uniref:glycerophosphodiester phosphodiesterase n=1 Tax=Turicibacter sanguinis TaxID=154288 RepID=UPI0018ABB0DE|nr:glycerophosphodiester phosphodiesterase family protein [Turicibacter sanguinis]MDB8552151.1 glycerophosphodiester phosphodiesterase family protein [Turicibacter sanguinis]
MANIKKFTDWIRKARVGAEVRDSLADGIEAINDEVESTTARQEHLERVHEQLIINAGTSNAEIVDARVDRTTGKSYDTVGKRMDETSAQLSKVATLSSFLSNPSTGFVAHRGSHILAPENTLKSIQLAGILGYEMIEIDVERTRDGVLILMHDSTVDRTTNGTGAVSNFTYDEIKKLKITEDYAGKDTNEIIRIPTLDEALAEARKHGLGVNLDCGKLTWTEETCHTAVGMLKKYGLYDVSFFVMTNQAQRNLLTSLYPDVNVTWLSSDTTSDWNINEAKKYKNAFITYNVANITDKLLYEYIHNGLAVFIYGCNTWESAYKYAKQGVRLIETDYILPKGVN